MNNSLPIVFVSRFHPRAIIIVPCYGNLAPVSYGAWALPFLLSEKPYLHEMCRTRNQRPAILIFSSGHGMGVQEPFNF